jgi:hypothetical protein
MRCLLNLQHNTLNVQAVILCTRTIFEVVLYVMSYNVAYSYWHFGGHLPSSDYLADGSRSF